MSAVKRIVGKIQKQISSHIVFRFFFTYMLLVSAALILAGSMFYLFYSKSLNEKNKKSMEQIHSQVMLNIDSSIENLQKITFLANYEDDLLSLSEEVNYKAENKTDKPSLDINKQEYMSLDNYFFNFLYSFSEIHGAYLYALDGTNILERNKDLTAHSNERADGEWWFQKALELRGRMVLVGKHENHFTEARTEVFSIARAICDFTNDSLIGVIVIDREVSALEHILKAADTNIIALLDEENNLISCSDEAAFSKLWKGELSEYVGKNKDSSAYYELGRGRNRLLVTQKQSDFTKWKLVSIQHYVELMTDMDKFIKILLGMLAVSFIITLCMAVYTSGHMTVNLKKMKAMMDEIDSGNLDAAIHVEGRDEIAVIADGCNSMLERIQELVALEYNEKLLRKQAQISMLQAQINPHFLYNTLGSIKALAQDEGSTQVARMIQRLSRLLRYNLGKEGKIVKIQEEVDNARNYLALQKLRFLDKFDAEFEIEDSLLCENIPAMTLQPVLENSFLHGFQNKLGKSLIKIRGFKEDRIVKIQVTDDGCGMSRQDEEEVTRKLAESRRHLQDTDSKSIGIYNVNLRIMYCFGMEYGLWIKNNKDEGVTVEIRLPAEKE